MLWFIWLPTECRANARMRRLIRVFAGRTSIFVGNDVVWLFIKMLHSLDYNYVSDHLNYRSDLQTQSMQTQNQEEHDGPVSLT